jgi:drug/metabolite transporter (DMT)-like permease
MTSAALAPPGIVNVRRGIFWMLGTSIFFVSLDATAKYLTSSYPVAEIVWGRYLFHTLFALMWAGPRLPIMVRRARFGMQVLRGLFLVVTTVLYFAAIATIPLADATSIMFLSPIVVTALSVPLLGEQVGIRRWIGVAVGFVGALIIVRPGVGVMQSAALICVVAAGINALYQITTRLLSRTDHPLTTNIFSPVVGVLAAAIGLPFAWVTPDLQGWLLMALAGLFGVVGHYCMIKAFESAPVAVVAPFAYVGLIWSTGYGYLLWGDLPDGWTLVGALIIVASGLYIFYREQVRKREGQSETPPA